MMDSEWQFLGEFHSSRNRGVKKWQIYIPQGSRKMKSIPRGPRGVSRYELPKKSLKIPENPQKNSNEFWKIFKQNSALILYFKLGNNAKKWSWNTEKFRQVSENSPKFSHLKEIQYFRGPRQILARIQGTEEW